MTGSHLEPVHHDHDTVLTVRDAVAGLPADLAELIRLVHWDGFSLEDAAAHLGIPASTARGRHARAKELLRRSLEPVTLPTAPDPPFTTQEDSQRAGATRR